MGLGNNEEDCLFVDAETEIITDGNITPPPVCFQFFSKTWDSGPTIFLADEGLDCLESALDEGLIIGGHNIFYDFGVATKARPSLFPKVFNHFEKGLVRDTGIRQKLLDIEAGMRSQPSMVFRRGEWTAPDYSLAGKVDQRTGKPKGKGLVWYYLQKDRSADKTGDSWRLRYGELKGLPLDQWPPEAIRYALEDVEDTGRVFYAQGPGALVNEQEQTAAAWALQLASAHGMLTDKEDVSFLESWATESWAKVQTKMLAEGLFRVEQFSAEDKRKNREPDTTITIEKRIAKKDGGGVRLEERPAKYVKNTDIIQARVKAAYEGMGLKVALTPSEEIKTDRDVLENSGDALLAELAEAGPVSTVLKTFLPTLKKGIEVPITTSFNVLLETGRISSFKPNLNNLPRSIWTEEQKEGLRKQYLKTENSAEKTYIFRLLTMGVRECFIPRPGFVFVSVDYDCAELRSLAQVCLWLFGKSSMAEFFQNDPHGDPHLALAANIKGITYEEALARKKELKGLRQAQKAVNFGYPGGLGPDTMIVQARKNYGVVMTRDEAVKAKQDWFQRWPEMREYLSYINRTVGMGQATVMQFRPGGLPHRKRGNVGYCDGANGFFQGLTSDGAKEALFRASRECYVDCGTALFGSRIVAFLYDELFAEVPEAIAHEASERLVRVMVEGMRAWLPDIPVVASPALSRRWFKSAEAVYDNDNRLIPWEPELKLLAS